MPIIKALIARELLNTWRNPQAILQPLLFFILTICLFPIALGADNASLSKIAPAALWIALLLAALLASEQLFYTDYQAGTLSQDIIHLEDTWLLLLAKLIAAWLRFALPLIVCLPLIILLLHIPLHALGLISALMMLGSFCLLLIGMIGAALTLSQSQSTFLVFLIVVPLYLPLLIIGVSATQDGLLGLPVSGFFALLGAFSLFSLITIVPFSLLAIKAQALP